MIRVWIITLLMLIGFAKTGLVFAADQSSSNYQNKTSTFVPAVFNSNSSNYQINGSIEPIVGGSASLGFGVQSGVPLSEAAAAAVTPPPTVETGGGGIGGLPQGIQPKPPTLLYKTPTFFSHQLIRGTREVRDTLIYVNNSTNGVILYDDLRWERDLPLYLGLNDIYVQAGTPGNARSTSTFGQIQRLLIGDVNSDRKVDDADISLFTRAWKKYNPFADFNEDAQVDDADLSLLASHWGASY